MNNVFVVTVIAPFDFGKVKQTKAFGSSHRAHQWGQERITYFDSRMPEADPMAQVWKHDYEVQEIEFGG